LAAQGQSQQSEQKLLIVIASDSDADSLIQKLVQRGYPATKVSSTGGFLRRGSATIFSGVDAEDVDNVIAIIRSECQARTEFLPAQALPFPESIYPAEPVEVRTGGAIVFVVGVERFERT
jgi:uncharacterized protein YaaQ